MSFLRVSRRLLNCSNKSFLPRFPSSASIRPFSSFSPSQLSIYSSSIKPSYSNVYNLLQRRQFGGHAHDGEAHEHFGSHFVDRAEIERRTLLIVNGFDKVDKSKVSITSSFKDLGLDSLDTVECIMSIEEEFMCNIDDEVASRLLTIKDVVDVIEKTPFTQPEPADDHH